MIYQQQCATSNLNTSLRRMIKLFCAAIIATTTWTQAQTITVLHSFADNSGGTTPVGGVTLDRAGNLYGTTSGIVSDSPSTAFKMSHAGSGWIFNILYTFNHPNDPIEVYAPVVFGPDGALYGTGYGGGQNTLGAVFSLQPPTTVCKSVSCPWTLTTLYSFEFGNDAIHPYLGSLVFDSAGNIYGTTYSGGTFVRGTVFKLTRSSNGWTESVLYSFSGGSDGDFPYNGVALDSAGNVYGTTSEGGEHGFGTVYELSPSGSGWTETTLYAFTGGDDGATPIGSVAVDAQGNLYGTTTSDGGSENGTVWELSPSNGGWAFTVLHSFAAGQYRGGGPWATPTLDAAGNIYGTARSTGDPGFGEAFTLTSTGGGWINTSYYFDGENGQWPECSVALDASGNLYGTSMLGGAGDWGAVWEITP
jgi:uncharacterized repeat protein (TIGR03803 family)